MNMNARLAACCFVAGALLLPIAGYAADTDPSSSPKQFVKDSVITTKIKAQLAANNAKTLVHVQVDTDDKGMVTLSGTAPSQKAIDTAVLIARAVKGVTEVDNKIGIWRDAFTGKDE
jgi:hyperosmotically inducible protein